MTLKVKNDNQERKKLNSSVSVQWEEGKSVAWKSHGSCFLRTVVGVRRNT